VVHVVAPLVLLAPVAVLVQALALALALALVLVQALATRASVQVLALVAPVPPLLEAVVGRVLVVPVLVPALVASAQVLRAAQRWTGTTPAWCLSAARGCPCVRTPLGGTWSRPARSCGTGLWSRWWGCSLPWPTCCIRWWLCCARCLARSPPACSLAPRPG
jgi:hypothetical protein